MRMLCECEFDEARAKHGTVGLPANEALVACHEVGPNCVRDGEGWLAHGPHEV